MDAIMTHGISCFHWAGAYALMIRREVVDVQNVGGGRFLVMTSCSAMMP